MKTCLKCRCGHHIASRDVMQRRTVHYGKANYVYLKFRCSHCKKLGELYVKPEDWNDNLFQVGKGEITLAEQKRFSHLGDITFDELRTVHSELEGLTRIPSNLLEE